MIRGFVVINLFYVLIMALIGCDNGATEQDYENLIEQSPFKHNNHGSDNTDTILILSCTLYDFELPGSFDLTDTLFYQAHDPNSKAASGYSLDPGQLRCLNQNGIILTQAPQESWSALRTAMLDAGAVLHSQRNVLVRRPTDIFELPTYHLEHGQSVFIQLCDDSLRGYRLEPGTFLWRFNLYLEHQRPDSRLCWQGVPVFRPDSEGAFAEIAAQASSSPRSTASSSEIVLDELTISAMLDKNSFIVLAGKLNTHSDPRLAAHLMTARAEGSVQQLVLVLVPSLQTGQQLKNALR